MNLKRVLGTVATTALVSTAVAVPALATVSYPGGGTWDYGVMSFVGTNWSNYYHGGRVHGSSVTGDGGLIRSACVSPGRWSYAYAYDSNPFRFDQAYWRYC